MLEAQVPPKAAIRLWTQEELALLKELAAQGIRLAAIALRLGRSYDSVRWRARRERIPLANFKPHVGGAKRNAYTWIGSADVSDLQILQTVRKE